ncbi:MAG: sensor histidine kinase [Betaproteobacteria bacterium]|nr:sensor histidine kinase [Betaproteobacteria bacterium]
MSFAAKLLDWLLAPLLFLWFASVAVTNFMAIDTVSGPYDQRLDEVARAMAQLLRGTDEELVFELSRDALIFLRADQRDELHYAIRRPWGEVLAGNPDLPPLPGMPEAGVTRFHSGFLQGEEVRVASLPMLTGGVAEDQPVIVQVAETLHKRHQLSGEIHTQVILPQLFVLVGALLLVWYGLTYVISPLKRLKEAMDRRHHRDLTPVDPADIPQELRPLITSINELMGRLAQNFQAQQRFIADAAHQLRTPLAGLKSQTELLLRQEDPRVMKHALTQLAASVQRTSRLANQLLSLARAETTGRTIRHDAVDLNDLARRVTEQWLPRAIDKRIDLGAEIRPEPLLVTGDALLLGEVLNNLLDNALHYTPSGGQVTVRTRFENGPVLSVEDTGIGIPPDERELVFQPFYRVLDSDPGGTGLGLAIVRSILDAHGAVVTLRNPGEGQGTIFELRFPKPGPYVREYVG